MKRITTVAAAALLTLGMLAGPASAKVEGPGTPGEKNCAGQTTAWWAQVGHEAPQFGPGIGNMLAFSGHSPQEFRALVNAYCSG